MGKDKQETTGYKEMQKLNKRYYSVRKPGDDKITDDAFNAEAKKLMMRQESAKPPEQGQAQELPVRKFGGWNTNPMNNNNIHSFRSSNAPNLENYNNGPVADNQYQFGQQENLGFTTRNNDVLSNLNQNLSIDNSLTKMNPINYKDVRVADINANPVNGNVDSQKINTYATVSENSDSKPYSHTTDALGAALPLMANIASTQMLKSGAESQKKKLLASIGTPRVQAEKVDYSRDRANIRSNQALTESTGRQVSKGAKSASEAASIRTMARLMGQRFTGTALSKSIQNESITNAQLRADANNTNAKLASQDQRQRLAIESQYGNVPSQLNADLLRSSAGIIQSASKEAEDKRQFYNALNMRSPNYELDFQESYNQMTDREKMLARLTGGRRVIGKKTVR